MKENNNHYQVSCFLYFMAQAWSLQESKAIFGDNLGEHFYNKWCGYKVGGTWCPSYASVQLYYEMTNGYRELLVSRAIEKYKNVTWFD